MIHIKDSPESRIPEINGFPVSRTPEISGYTVSRMPVICDSPASKTPRSQGKECQNMGAKKWLAKNAEFDADSNSVYKIEEKKCTTKKLL